MAREINRLNARSAQTLGPGFHADGSGLYLRVEPTGARRWIFVFSFQGRRKEMGLGPLTDVSLATAREAVRDARSQIRTGRNPIDERRALRASQSDNTFGDVALQLIADLGPEWKSPVHRRQWRATLEAYAKPIWDLRPAQIGTDDILKVLRPIWLEIPETASRVRGRIERVLDAAKVKGLRQGISPHSVSVLWAMERYQEPPAMLRVGWLAVEL